MDGGLYQLSSDVEEFECGDSVWEVVWRILNDNSTSLE
jgi:hypothetical protein